MRPLSETEIEGYLVRDEPYDCAGSYRFESLGAALFDSVEGNDPTAIEGMPLLVLTRILREFGIAAF
jgi:predicted house-cleaning NTP pyrophosphatase (Maf/HAM1 superfamily)